MVLSILPGRIASLRIQQLFAELVRRLAHSVFAAEDREGRKKANTPIAAELEDVRQS